MRASKLLALISGAAPVAVAVACYGPTQMTVEVQTDLTCAEQLRAALYAGGAGEAIGETAESECTPLERGGATLGDLVLVPGGERTASVTVKVKLGVGTDAQGNRVDAKRCDQGAPGCVLASRRFVYAEHEQKRIVVRLYRDCLGKVCPDGQTCVQGGACVSEEVTCQGSECGVQDEKPFTPIGDAGGPDAPPDSSVDAPLSQCVAADGTDRITSILSASPPDWTEVSPSDVYWIEGTELRRFDKATRQVTLASNAGELVEAFVLVAGVPATVVTTASGTRELRVSTPATGVGADYVVPVPGVGTVRAMTFAPAQGLVVLADDQKVYFVDPGTKGLSPGPDISGPARALAYDASFLYVVYGADRRLDAYALTDLASGKATPLEALRETAVVSDPLGAFAARHPSGGLLGDINRLGGTSLAPLFNVGTGVTELALSQNELWWIEGGDVRHVQREAKSYNPVIIPGRSDAPPVKLLVDPEAAGCFYTWSLESGAIAKANLRIYAK